jgi:hypothetical protein
VQVGYNSWGHAGEATAIRRDYAGVFGFDPSHNRTKASSALLDLLKRVNGDIKLLVDQHAYFDLRLFRLSGVNLEYINMYNVDQVLSGLDPSKSYLVLFSKGTTALDSRVIASQQRWADSWTERQKDLYQTYQSKLFGLAIVRRFPGEPQVILDPGPIRPDDDIYIAAAGELASANALARLRP